MAEIKIIMDSDEAKVFRAFQKLEEQIRKTEKTTKKLSDTTRSAGKAGEKAFGRQQHSKIIQFAAGLVTIQAALGAIRKGYQLWREEQDKAIQGLDRAKSGLMDLVSISRNMKELQANIGLVRKFVDVGLQPEAAAATVFRAKSLGLKGADIQALTTVAPFGAAEPFARLIAKSRGSFGAAESGSATAIIRKGFAAAAASEVAPAQFASLFARIAPFAAALGLSDEEAQAALVQTISLAGSPEEGATQLSGLLAQTQKLVEGSPELGKNIKKGGLSAILDFVAAGGGKGGRRSFKAGAATGTGPFAVLGNKRAVAGFLGLQRNRQATIDVTRQINKAATSPIVAERLQIARQFPITAGALRLDKARAAEALSLLELTAPSATKREAAVTEAGTRAREKGAGAFGIFAAKTRESLEQSNLESLPEGFLENISFSPQSLIQPNKKPKEFSGLDAEIKELTKSFKDLNATIAKTAGPEQKGKAESPLGPEE